MHVDELAYWLALLTSPLAFIPVDMSDFESKLHDKNRNPTFQDAGEIFGLSICLIVQKGNPGVAAFEYECYQTIHSDISSRRPARQGASEEPAPQRATQYDGMDWTYVAMYSSVASKCPLVFDLNCLKCIWGCTTKPM